MVYKLEPARTARGVRLKRIRLDRELTQAQLAEKVGVTTTAISQYECGRDDPSLEVLIRLLAALQCTFEDLLESPDAAPPPR